MQSRAVRRSNLELLRILCMLFIVAHHFGVHGQYGDMEMSAFNRFIVNLLSAGGKLGVNIYVIISGYFLVKSDFKPRRIINTLALTVFYSVTVYLALSIVAPGFIFSPRALLQSFFVISNTSHWFVTRYVSMLLLSPFLNKLLYNISERAHLLLIAVLLLMQMTLPGTGSYIPLSDTGWFITLYITAAYIRLYPKAIFGNKLALGISSVIFCTVIGLWTNSTNMTNLFCLLPSVSLFCLFNSIEIKHSRFINLISRTTFAIYLIHDHVYMREFLWVTLFNCPFHATLDSFWLFSAVAVMAVFTVCSLIDLIRILFTNPLIPYIKKLLEKTASALKKIFCRIGAKNEE